MTVFVRQFHNDVMAPVGLVPRHLNLCRDSRRDRERTRYRPTASNDVQLALGYLGEVGQQKGYLHGSVDSHRTCIAANLSRRSSYRDVIWRPCHSVFGGEPWLVKLDVDGRPGRCIVGRSPLDFDVVGSKCKVHRILSLTLQFT